MEEHPLPADLIDHCRAAHLRVKKQMPANFLVVKSKPFLVEIVSNVEDRQINVRTRQFLQRNEQPSPKISRDHFAKLLERYVWVHFLQQRVIFGRSPPKIEIRRILCQQQVTALLQQKTLRKCHTAQRLLCEGVCDSV